MAVGPRLSTAILGSRFGRRLFVLFCLAALVPASVVFWMTYRTATADAEAARRETLRTGAKNYALGVFERMQLAGGALATLRADALAQGSADPVLGLYFSDVRVRPRGVGDPPAGAAQAAGARLRLVQGDGGMVPVLEHADGDRYHDNAFVHRTLDPSDASPPPLEPRASIGPYGKTTSNRS